VAESCLQSTSAIFVTVVITIGRAAETIIVVVVENYVQTRRGPISGAAVRPGPWTRRCRRQENGRIPVAGKYEPCVVRFVVRSKHE